MSDTKKSGDKIILVPNPYFIIMLILVWVILAFTNFLYLLVSVFTTMFVILVFVPSEAVFDNKVYETTLKGFKEDHYLVSHNRVNPND